MHINDITVYGVLLVNIHHSLSFLFFTYVIDGSGEPPTLLHTKSCCLSSVATVIVPGATIGGCGGVNTVKL